MSLFRKGGCGREFVVMEEGRGGEKEGRGVYGVDDAFAEGGLLFSPCGVMFVG
jgi:hypothetical protein